MNDTPCFTDFALQEYAFGRLDADVRREVESHVSECEACRDSLALLNDEARLLRAGLLQQRPTNEDGVGAGTEELARYLDGALDAAAVADLETRLLADPDLLLRLVRLREEVSSLLAEQVDGVRRSVPAPPAGQILRMPKRTKLPVVVWNRDRRIGEA